jgi:hypothetical protein
MDLYEHSNTKGAVSLTFEGCAKAGRCRSFMTLVMTATLIIML